MPEAEVADIVAALQDNKNSRTNLELDHEVSYQEVEDHLKTRILY